jgi:hypothetical protein
MGRNQRSSIKAQAHLFTVHMQGKKGDSRRTKGYCQWGEHLNATNACQKGIHKRPLVYGCTKSSEQCLLHEFNEGLHDGAACSDSNMN